MGSRKKKLEQGLRLSLRAENSDDLEVISGLTQDSITEINNIKWFKHRRRFSIFISRKTKTFFRNHKSTF